MTYDQIQNFIDMGNGFEAQQLGPPYDVYRVTGSSSGNVIQSGNKIASAVPVVTSVGYGTKVRQSLDTEHNQGIIWYEIVTDLRNFLVGDIFVLNDPKYGQGSSSVNFSTNQFKGFALSDHEPMKQALGGRLNCNVTIFRPSAAPNSSGQWDKTKLNAQPVILNSGTFSLGSVGNTPAQIPAGLIALGRSYGDRSFLEVPGEQRKSGWELYVPPLNGFNVKDGDRIVGPDGARYIVVIPYTQVVGTTGGQWFLEREASGP